MTRSSPYRWSQHPLNRRRLVAGTAAGAGLAALGATRHSPTLAQDTAAVEFWTPGGSGAFCEGFEEIGAAYDDLVGNQTTTINCVGGDQPFNEVLLARIAAGNPPDATIIWTSPIALAVRGALTPLDEWMPDSRYSQVENWPASVLASCQIDGQTYGLPVAAGSYAMIYNQELFEEVGLPSGRDEFPKTWDELRQASAAITQWDGDTLVRVGMLPPRSAQEFPIWVATNGGQIYDAGNYAYHLDSDAVVETLTSFVSWLDDEYRGDIIQVDLAGNWTTYVVEGRPPAFQEGLLGMLGNGFWMTGEFYAQGEPSFERWEVAQYPVGPSGTTTASGYWPNWTVVPANAAHPQEGFGFVDYIGGPEGMAIWFTKIPDLPTNTTVPPLLPQTLAERRGEEVATDIVAFFKAQLDVATPMWTSPIQDFADDQIARILERAYAHEGEPGDLLAEAQTACQTELDRVMANRS